MKQLLAIAFAASLAGCTTATYNPKTGIKYKNILFQKQFSEMSIGKDGTVSIKGYQSEAATLVKAAAEGVAAGLYPTAPK